MMKKFLIISVTATSLMAVGCMKNSLESRMLPKDLNEENDNIKSNTTSKDDSSEKNSWLETANHHLRGLMAKIVAANKPDHLACLHALQADLKQNKIDGMALHLAAFYGDQGAVEFILQQGIDVNFHRGEKNNCRTPLMVASLAGHKGIAKLLLQQENIEVDLRDSFDGTALMDASKRGHTKIVKMLVQAGANPNLSGGVNSDKNSINRTPLISASQGGFTEIVDFLLGQNGVDIDFQDAQGNTALICAVLVGRGEVVELLLKKGANVNIVGNLGWTALIGAAATGDLNIAKLLITHRGKNINVGIENHEGATALTMAVDGGYEDIAKLILDLYPDNSSREKDSLNEALWLAARINNEELANKLVHKGANVNSKNREKTNEEGMTALMYAAERGYIDVMYGLLKNGAKVNERNKFQATALTFASMHGYLDAIELLCRYGAIDINMPPPAGCKTPAATIAATAGQFKALNLILKLKQKDYRSCHLTFIFNQFRREVLFWLNCYKPGDIDNFPKLREVYSPVVELLMVCGAQLPSTSREIKTKSKHGKKKHNRKSNKNYKMKPKDKRNQSQTYVDELKFLDFPAIEKQVQLTKCFFEQTPRLIEVWLQQVGIKQGWLPEFTHLLIKNLVKEDFHWLVR